MDHCMVSTEQYIQTGEQLMNNTAMGNRMCTNKHAKLVFSCWRHKTRRTKRSFPRWKPFEINHR